MAGWSRLAALEVEVSSQTEGIHFRGRADGADEKKRIKHGFQVLDGLTR